MNTNIPLFQSVTELSFSLKRTLEDSYGRIRVRGELSRVKLHSSGHLYSDLKDDQSVLNLVCWRSVVQKLPVKPEEGLEVICTGKISSYPARSNYQLIIESIELAGEGALLKILEERKRKLSAEGVFDPANKKPLPFLPERIGVITSPTGAVIRDIMHRIDDRFPRPVLLWPVNVQGVNAAPEIIKAIRGFNSLLYNSKHRPDLIILARGGGSLEDLMAFNEEDVVRAVAASEIPIITAVGHETDTTLVDYASDIRAPTPTGAAEIAVPKRIDIHAAITDHARRLYGSMTRLLEFLKLQADGLHGRLGDPCSNLDIKTQTLDNFSDRLDIAYSSFLNHKLSRVDANYGRLVHPKTMIKTLSDQIKDREYRLHYAVRQSLERKFSDFNALDRMLETLSFKRVLERGFTVIWDDTNRPVTSADLAGSNQSVKVEFKNSKLIKAVLKPDV